MKFKHASPKGTHQRLLLLLLCCPLAAHAIDDRSYLNQAIDTQPLEPALQHLSRQTGLQFVYDPAHIGNPFTSAVRAGTSATEALLLMLRGTGLRFQQLDESTITLLVDHPVPTLTAPATTEPAAPTTLDTVRVTGYQHDLARAVDLKRNGVLLGDSLVSGELASFPDTNLAESLQRLPGVAITREAGEGRQVTLRGLGPEFTRVRINGMEVLSTNAGIDSHGGINRTRGFDFNVFPSDIFGRIAVIRANDAVQGEGGLAGTIDLHTPRPFDHPGRHTSVAVGSLYQDSSGRTTPRAAVLMSDTWVDGRLGGLLSIAFSEQETLEFGHSTVRWASGGWNLANVSAIVDPATVSRLNSDGPDALFYPRFNRYDVYQHRRLRSGGAASLQLQASDAVQLQLDLLFGQLRTSRTEYHLDASAFSRNNADGLYNTGLREITVKELSAEGNSIVQGDYGNVDIRSDTHQNRSTTRYRQAVLGLLVDGAVVKLEASLGVQSSRFDNPADNNAYLFSQNQNFSIDYRGLGRVPAMRYGFDVADTTNWFMDTLRVRHGNTSFRTSNARLALRLPLSGNFSLSTGIEARVQVFDSHYWSSDYTDARFRSVDDSAGNLPYDFAAGINRDEAPRHWSLILPDQALDAFGMGQRQPALDPGATWRVRETPLASWLQLEMDTQISGLRWRSSLGLRPVRTWLSTTGYVDDGRGLEWKQLSQHYSHVLPSLNSNLQLAPGLVWRLSVHRNISRPPLAALTPNRAVDSLNREITSGNPSLSPVRATAIDSSLEWYFGNSSMLAVSVFYKDIDGFIVSTLSRSPYQDSGYPLALLNPAVVTPSQTFTFVRPENGHGTHLLGTELSWQQRWGHFGVQLNHTWASAQVQVQTSVGDLAQSKLPGLSRNTLNATLSWEQARLSVRTSATWRDRYLTAIPGGNGNDVAGVNSSLYLDAALRFKLNRDWSLTVEASNLTSEVDDQYVDSSNRVYHYARGGWQAFFGVRMDL